MGTPNQIQGEKKGGTRGIKIAGAVLLSAVFLSMAGAIIYLTTTRQPEEEEERRNVVVNQDNVEEVINQMEQRASEELAAPGYYTVKMNYEWRFATGDAASENAYVENVVTNTNAVYLDLFLAEDEENAIYKSPVLPLGSSLQNISLDTPLEAGTYDCVAVYHLVDDDQKTLSTLRVTVTVIVEG